MRTLAHAARKGETLREPLPWNFPQWQRVGIIPRRGNVTMIAATPAAGKTFVALKIAEKIKEPILFFSADTDEETMLVRAAAIASGQRQDAIRTELLLDEGGREHYGDVLANHFGHVRFVWESDPTYEDLALETAACAEVLGTWPSIIIIDTLMKLVGESDNEWSSMRDSTKAIDRLARITGASVIVLHHMSENSSRPDFPPPKRDIQGKVSQLPAVIVSLAMAQDGSALRACAVKNRLGVGDPSGNTFVEVPVDFDRGSFFRDRASKEAGIRL